MWANNFMLKHLARFSDSGECLPLESQRSEPQSPLGRCICRAAGYRNARQSPTKYSRCATIVSAMALPAPFVPPVTRTGLPLNSPVSFVFVPDAVMPLSLHSLPLPTVPDGPLS